MVFVAQDADTPVGKFVGVPIPVANVVVCVMFVNVVFIHKVGVEEAVLVVIAGVIVIIPVAFTVPQPPVNGIE